jgi:hypothetical protein
VRRQLHLRARQTSRSMQLTCRLSEVRRPTPRWTYFRT